MKQFFTITLLFSFYIGQSQITEEASFNPLINYENIYEVDSYYNDYKVDIDVLRFIGFNSNDGVFKLFSIEGQELKSGTILGDYLRLPSTKLFNNDDLVEFLIINGNNTKLYNENGEMLFDFGDFASDAYEYRLVKKSDGTHYLIFHSSTTGNYEENDTLTKVFSIGTPSLTFNAPVLDEKPVLFPNPTNAMLSLNSEKNYKIQVFDLNGRKLMEQNGNSLNMEHLSNATYVVKAMDVDTKELLSYRVVKE